MAEPETRMRRELTALRFPAPMSVAIKSFARRCGVTRSEAVRALVAHALTAHGSWPPAERTDGR